jgi:hypothetical protein
MSQENIQAETAAPVKEGIQQGLADRSEAMQSIARTRENIGHVAAGWDVKSDEQGNLLLPRDEKELATKGSHDEVRV